MQGCNSRLDEIQAAILRIKLQHLGDWNAERKAIAARYDAILPRSVVTPPQVPAWADPVWHLYVIRLADDAGITRDAFIEGMFAAGIGCSVHYVPLHQHPYWRDRYGLKPEHFPHSQKAFERTVSLPLYTAMTDDDVERVIAAMGEGQ